MKIRNQRIVGMLLIVALIVGVLSVTSLFAGGQTLSANTGTAYQCYTSTGQADGLSTLNQPTCPANDILKTWLVQDGTTTTTTQPTTTTKATTTTQATTTTTGSTTTTTGGTQGSFLSYPHQTSPTSISGGSNVVVSNKSWQGFTGKVALIVSGVHNLYLHDLDFSDNGGDIFLINVTGQIRIENIRANNTGDGSIGSGHSNVIQLNNSFDDGTGGIRNVKAYGGRTEDMISIFQSGGIDASHPLIIENIHLESPTPPNTLSWTSGSGTCINLADAGGHDITLRNSTFLNCGAVGIQMNIPTRVLVTNNIVYGAARAGSNVGLSQYNGGTACSCQGNAYTNNRVWWVKANGSASPIWTQNSNIQKTGNTLQDTTINPNSLKVIL